MCCIRLFQSRFGIILSLSIYLAGLCLYPVKADASNQAKKACLRQAQSPLEQLYCEIKAKGEGKILPTLTDFRRNNKQVQTLLLKRDAEKLGLAIPVASGARSPGTGAQPPDDEKTTASTGQPVQSKPAVKQVAMINRPPSEATSVSFPRKAIQNTQVKLSACELKRRQIRCGKQSYALVNNLPNSKLSPAALSAGNQLRFPRWQNESNISEHAYLTQTYRIYIDKMLQIGLGAATMSFTRFHDNYYDLKSQNIDFNQRFSQMYEYLKNDKQKMQVPSQLISKLPEGIQFCDLLRADLIVCDNGFNNWLYMKKNKQGS